MVCCAPIFSPIAMASLYVECFFASACTCVLEQSSVERRRKVKHITPHVRVSDSVERRRKVKHITAHVRVSEHKSGRFRTRPRTRYVCGRKKVEDGDIDIDIEIYIYIHIYMDGWADG